MWFVNIFTIQCWCKNYIWSFYLRLLFDLFFRTSLLIKVLLYFIVQLCCTKGSHSKKLARLEEALIIHKDHRTIKTNSHAYAVYPSKRTNHIFHRSQWNHSSCTAVSFNRMYEWFNVSCNPHQQLVQVDRLYNLTSL